MAENLISNWMNITRVWAQLHECPVNAPDSAIQDLMDAFVELTSSTHACVVISVRHTPHSDLRPDPLWGWRLAYKIERLNNSPSDPTYSQAWAANPANIECNPIMQGQVAGFGQLRAVLRDDLIGDQSWADSQAGDFHAHYNISDRMTAMLPLSDTSEMWVLLERRGETRDFTDVERELVLALAEGVTALCTRFVLSFGLLHAAQTPLTTRERETLLHLLDSKAEKDIAAAMGLTVRSTHQNVVSVFRKLNVNSRAELMAMWMMNGRDIDPIQPSVVRIRN